MQWVKVPAKNTHEIFFSGNLIGFPKEKFQEAGFLKKHIAKKIYRKVTGRQPL